MRGKDEVDVTLRYPEEAQRDVETLLKLEIPVRAAGWCRLPVSRVWRRRRVPRPSGARMATVS